MGSNPCLKPSCLGDPGLGSRLGPSAGFVVEILQTVHVLVGFLTRRRTPHSPIGGGIERHHFGADALGVAVPR
jgi:hypothetical protein